MKKYNYTYQTKNLLNSKTYVGVHSTDDLNDGYLGSGLALMRAFRKYGKDNFASEILSFFDTREDASEEEEWLVDANWIKSDDNYNLVIGGGNGTLGFIHSMKTKAKMKASAAKRDKSTYKTYIRTPEICKKISDTKKGVSNPKVAAALKGRTTWNAKPILDTETGIFYTPIEFRTAFPEYNWNTMRARLSGQKINNTKFTR